MESSSASASLKKARRPGSGTQVPSCLVDGCSSDLGKCRDYHRRHKVCELHSKSSKVLVKGQERRFCQQCSRFHPLGEFDEGKRSCRKRLEGHNRRRRKPQPDTLSTTSPKLFPNHQGAMYIHFGDPQAISASTTTASLAEVVKVEDDSAIYNCQSSLNFNSGKKPLPGSSSNEGGKQFPFLQGTDSMFPGEPIGQATLNAATILVDSGSQKMFSDGLNRVIDSNRALSLLSSPPAETLHGANMCHVVQPDPTVPAQSSMSNLSYNSSVGVGVPAGSLMVSDRSNADIHKQNMFHLFPDESSTSGVQQKMSFSWE